MIKERRGSVLIEGAYGLLAMTVAVLLTIEISRRTLVSVTLYHASFVATRERTLGASELEARQGVYQTMRRAFGGIPLFSPHARLTYQEFYIQDRASLSDLQLGRNAGGFIQLNYNYSQFIGQRTTQGWKSRQEVLERCLFPF